MTPVYQTIFSKGNGNCLTAVWASLLNLKIEEVPHFVAYDDYFGVLCDFVGKYGYEYERYIVNPNRKDIDLNGYDIIRNPLPEYGSINGLFDATVYSPKYFDKERFLSDPEYTPVCHAVIVDKDLNIIHDPQPEYKGTKQYPMHEELGFNGIIGISLFVKFEN